MNPGRPRKRQPSLPKLKSLKEAMGVVKIENESGSVQVSVSGKATTVCGRITLTVPAPDKPIEPPSLLPRENPPKDRLAVSTDGWKPKKGKRYKNHVTREIEQRAGQYAKLSKAGVARVMIETQRRVSQRKGDGSFADQFEAIIRGGIEPSAVAPNVHAERQRRRTLDSATLYNLRHRVAPTSAISLDQFEAGKRYHDMHAALAAFPSNTGAVLDRLANGQLWTSDDVDKMNSGEMMKPLSEDRIPSKESSTLAEALKLKRVDVMLDRFDRAVLHDVCIEERSVASIAAKYNVSPEQMSFAVRLALWRLVAALECADAEYRAFIETWNGGPR